MVGFSSKSDERVKVCGSESINEGGEKARNGLLGESRTGPGEGGSTCEEVALTERVTGRRREGGGETGALGGWPDLNRTGTGEVEAEGGLGSRRFS